MVASLAALLCGCAKENIEQEGGQSSHATKVINTPDNADAGSILVYVADGAAGTEALDSIALAAGALSIEPLFESFPGREAEERRFGLDRWYELKLKKGTSLEAAAAVLSAQKPVQKVQYNTRMTNVINRRAHSYRPSMQTKAMQASGSAFNDPMLKNQWSYRNEGKGSPVWNSVAGADVNVTDAWKLTGGDPSIIVAVVDEGVAYSHPDLKDNIWTNPSPTKNDVHGYNFVTDNGRVTWTDKSDTGHGTHVAGTIAAVNNNSTGVCGIAGGTGKNDGVKIMSCQIFSGDNGGESSQIAKAAKYAADHGAVILQCSFGVNGGEIKSDNEYLSDKDASAEVAAYRYFVNSERDSSSPIDGGLAIFAAGNETASMAGYPVAMTDMIAVTAIGCDNRPTSYTNYGPGCNIAAPGGDSYSACTTRANLSRATEEAGILSTLPQELQDDYYDGSGYGYMEGTSMACPHVSGVAALGLSYMKKLGRRCTPDEFKAMLLTSVDAVDQYCTGSTYYYDEYSRVRSVSYSGYKGKMGTGSIDAWKLLMQIEGTPCEVMTVGDEQALSLEPYFGSVYSALKYTGVDISAEDMQVLGLKSAPQVVNGKITLTPVKSGNVKITVKAVAGGTAVGTGSTMGGMEISRTISVLARGVKAANGGWL